MKVKKYIGIFIYSLKKQFNFKLNYFTTLFGYAMHVFILNCLWDYILKGKLLIRI